MAFIYNINIELRLNSSKKAYIRQWNLRMAYSDINVR
jgi:hypothetical protein